MGDTKRRLLAGSTNDKVVLLKPKWDFRVIELPGRLTIRRVEYDMAGHPLAFSKDVPEVYGADGDELLAIINALAEALTKPSLVEGDFMGLVS